MKQKLKPETWVGIFLIAGILMIIGVILGFGNIKTSKEQTYPINIIFKDAAGLIKDSQIRLGGVTVGKVTKAPELLPRPATSGAGAEGCQKSPRTFPTA